MTSKTPTPSEQSKAMAEMFQKMATYGGGPASPMQVEVGKSENGEPTIWFSMGMTKREHIAAIMMAALVTKMDVAGQSVVANEAASYADALLERLKK